MKRGYAPVQNHRSLFMTLLLLSAVVAAPTSTQAAAERTQIPDYSKAQRAQVPEAMRFRLDDIFPTTASWEKTMASTKQDLQSWESGAASWASSAHDLAVALEHYERISVNAMKLYYYASLQTEISMDPDCRTMLGDAQRLMSSLDSAQARLQNSVLKLGSPTSQKWQKEEPRLTPYQAYVREALRNEGHARSDEVEETAAMAGTFSGDPRIIASLLLGRDLPRAQVTAPDGKRVAVDGAVWRSMSASQNAEERKSVCEAISLNRGQYANTFAALLDSCVKTDIFNARLHHHADCLTAEMFEYDMDPVVYRNLIDTVKANLGPCHRYLRLRREMLGLNELHEHDNYVPLVPGVDMKFGFEEARRLLQTATAVLGPEYSVILRQAFEDRWVDVYGHEGKMGRGSVTPVYGVHPYVLLDYRGSFFDLITVAHEVGHAINFYCAEKAQPFVASTPTWLLSEVPSTFNEILVMKQMIKELPDDRIKLALMGEYLSRLNLLLFSSVQGADMQLAFHEAAEQGTALTPDWLNARHLELSRHYAGHSQGVMVIDDYVKYDWIHSSNYFSSFQDYFYALGTAVSLAFADRIATGDPAEAHRYMSFLSSGTGKPAMDIIRDAGIDISTPAPILAALRQYDDLVTQMETLYRKLNTTPKQSEGHLAGCGLESAPDGGGSACSEAQPFTCAASATREGR